MGVIKKAVADQMERKAKQVFEAMPNRLKNVPGWRDLSVNAQAGVLMKLLGEVLNEAFGNLDDLTEFANRLMWERRVTLDELPQKVPLIGILPTSAGKTEENLQ